MHHTHTQSGIRLTHHTRMHRTQQPKQPRQGSRRHHTLDGWDQAMPRHYAPRAHSLFVAYASWLPHALCVYPLPSSVSLLRLLKSLGRICPRMRNSRREVVISSSSLESLWSKVLAKNRRNWHVNSRLGLKVAKTRFQTFFRRKTVSFKWKCQIREFHEIWNGERRSS